MARHKVVTGAVALAALGLIVYAVGFGATSSGTPTSAPSTPSGAGSTSSSPPRKPVFPPQTLDDFRAFAATGDASQVTEIDSSSEGLPSCPVRTFYVAVSSGLTPKEVEAGLSAFAVQQGLLDKHCGGFVYAFRSAADYQAHFNDGYTVGRVSMDTDGGGSPRGDLEVDAGDQTSGSIQATFKFTFYYAF